MNVRFTFNELMIIQIRLSHCTRNVDYVLFMIIIYYIVINNVSSHVLFESKLHQEENNITS